MYQRGELVVYGMHGVCKILDLEIKMMNRKKTEYYVLSPVANEQARFYVPTQNQAAVSKLRPILTRDAVIELLKSIDLEKCSWVEDDNKRKVLYKEIINRGDREELISLIRLLHVHRSEQFSQGRKFHLSDDTFLRDAEKLISSEISMVMGIPHGEVRQFIHERVK